MHVQQCMFIVVSVYSWKNGSITFICCRLLLYNFGALIAGALGTIAVATVAAFHNCVTSAFKDVNKSQHNFLDQYSEEIKLAQESIADTEAAISSMNSADVIKKLLKKKAEEKG